MNDSDFFALCQKDSLQQINEAIRNGANVNAKRQNDGATVLMFAAFKNTNPEVMAALIKAGANVNARNEEGMTALMFAANNSNPEVIATLVKEGANVSATDKKGWTPLMFCIMNNNPNPDVIRAFINLKV